MKYVTLIKDQNDIEEKEQWILPFINSYSKICSAIEVFISCSMKDTVKESTWKPQWGNRQTFATEWARSYMLQQGFHNSWAFINRGWQRTLFLP